MDDLASEGLLLIRITADDSGRFGLNVRVSGGVRGGGEDGEGGFWFGMTY